MKKKRVLLFSRDPGGCNSIAPLYAFLMANNFEISLYGKDFSINQMRSNFSLNPVDFNAEFPSATDNEIKAWIASLKPDAVITGTSFGDYSERQIWSACENLEIPSFAILDHWINYGIRFHKLEGGFIFPRYIVVADTKAQALASEDGLPRERLRAWGNPYYQFLDAQISPPPRVEIRQRLHCSETTDKLVIFASEDFANSPATYGYTQQSILESLVRAFTVNLSGTTKVTLVVRPHPKENLLALKTLCQSLHCEGLKVTVSSEETSLDLISASDLVCGMISQFLIEAAVMKKLAVSIQIGLNTKDPFILTQRGILPLMKSQSALDNYIRGFLLGELIAPGLELPTHCMENILAELEKIA